MGRRQDKRKEKPSKDVDTDASENAEDEEDEFVVERVVDRRTRNGKVSEYTNMKYIFFVRLST